MNRTKYIVRITLVLLIIALFVNLYRRQSNDNIARVAKFKFEALNKIKSDSLGTGHKIDLLVDETAKFNKQFIEPSPQVRDSLHYLIGAVCVLIASEVFFLIARRRRTPE